MKCFRLLPLLGLMLLCAGCGISVRNMTPQAMTRNPSGLYPISLEVVRNDNSVVAGSVQPTIITPDLTAPMLATPHASNRWEYTIAVPANVNEWPYKFKISYKIEQGFVVRKEPAITIDPDPPMVYVLRITDRTAVGLDARRGRVGSLIKVLGRGFRPTDQVVFNGQVVPTRYETESTLNFQIPPIAGNRTYTIELQSGDSKLKCGDLLVDISSFLTDSNEMSIALDATARIEIALPQPAPPGGLTVRMESTDPSVLEMPSTVVIPEGQSRVQVTVKAKHMGSGSIHLSAEGFNPSAIPFRIVLTRHTPS